MEYVKLGRTGLEVSRICLGCMSYGVSDRGNHAWSLDEEETRPFIKRALEGGINFFDTANRYSLGSSEEILGRAASHEAERVAPDMALQVEDALSGNVAEFGGFDGMESVLTCAKPIEHVVAGCVARVDGSALIPISAVGINRIYHGRLVCSKPTSPMCIVYQV